MATAEAGPGKAVKIRQISPIRPIGPIRQRSYEGIAEGPFLHFAGSAR